MELEETLARRLLEIGLDPTNPGDPAAAWRSLHERFGRRITLLDRYALEAADRGVRPDKLDPATRARLGEEVLAVQFPGIDVRPEAARRDGVLEVVPYEEAWPARYEAWRRRLASALGPTAVRIEHVGSTAVPGLAAKPVIDIQVSVPDPEDEGAYVPAVEACDLRLRSRDPGHRYFRPPADRPREVHVHVCGVGSVWEWEHLLFRDYLGAHPQTAAAYGALKLDLAQRYADDRLVYTDAKSNFIVDVLEAADAWARRSARR